MNLIFKYTALKWIAVAVLIAGSDHVISAASDKDLCATRVAEALKASDRVTLALRIWGELPEPGDVVRSKAYVGEVLHQLGAIRSVKPLSRFPDGLTEKIDVGVPPASNVPYTGYTFLLSTAKEGDLLVFLAVRNDAMTCRLWSLAVHFPAERRARAGEVLQAARKAAGL